jgi:2-iminobutanoate/2-iminopropanoate deaminase
MKIVNSDKAPAAVGPYSQAIATGKLVFLAGQIPLVPGTSDFAGTDITSQTRQCLKNIEAVLASEGLTLANVVKSTVLMQDLKDFAAMNVVYAEMFGAHKPARSTFQVAALPRGALVEIEVIASRE